MSKTEKKDCYKCKGAIKQERIQESNWVQRCSFCAKIEKKKRMKKYKHNLAVEDMNEKNGRAVPDWFQHLDIEGVENLIDICIEYGYSFNLSFGDHSCLSKKYKKLVRKNKELFIRDEYPEHQS